MRIVAFYHDPKRRRARERAGERESRAVAVAFSVQRSRP
jgi:hypothetical protein